MNTCPSAATSSTVQVMTTASARGSGSSLAGGGSIGWGVGARPSGNEGSLAAAASAVSAGGVVSSSASTMSVPRERR